MLRLRVFGFRLFIGLFPEAHVRLVLGRSIVELADGPVEARVFDLFAETLIGSDDFGDLGAVGFLAHGKLITYLCHVLSHIHTFNECFFISLDLDLHAHLFL